MNPVYVQGYTYIIFILLIPPTDYYFSVSPPHECHNSRKTGPTNFFHTHYRLTLFMRMYSISIALGVNSIALGDNSKAYGDNSKGLRR